MTDESAKDIQAKYKRALERKTERHSPINNSQENRSNLGKAQGSKASNQMFRRKSGSA
jgi:hypothetical protein